LTITCQIRIPKEKISLFKFIFFVVNSSGAWYPGVMAIPVVEFSREGYKIRKVFG
jgi:hypothetical protein